MIGPDYATVKSSSDVAAVDERFDGQVNSLDRPSALAVDGDNDVLVTGYSAGSGSGADYATIKYSSDGVPLWTNRYNDGSSYALAVDGSNNVIVTGVSTGGGNYGDYATIKY